MKSQILTIEVIYDETVYGRPETWNWSQLAGSEVLLHDGLEPEPYTD